MKEKQRVSVSILGDSISTFEGWQPPSYACFYTAPNQQRNQLESVKDMWWARVMDALGGNLCANSSYSGSRVRQKRILFCCFVQWYSDTIILRKTAMFDTDREGRLDEKKWRSSKYMCAPSVKNG